MHTKKFIDRKNELERLSEWIEGRFNVLIIGMPGIGKTEILRALNAKQQGKHDFYRVDLENTTSKQAVMDRIARALRKDLLPANTDRSYREWEDLRDALKKRFDLETTRTKYAIFVIDDFKPRAVFLEVIRSIENALDEDLNVVFVATIRPGNFVCLVEQEQQLAEAVFQKYLWLAPLEIQHAKSLVSSYIEGQDLQSDIPPALYDEISDLSGGNPRLAELIIQAVVGNVTLQKIAPGQLAKGLCSESGRGLLERAAPTLGTQNYRELPLLTDIWSDLDLKTQVALTSLAKFPPDQIPPDEDRWWFERVGLLKKGTLKIFSAVFESFVKELSFESQPAIPQRKSLSMELSRSWVFSVTISLILWNLIGALIYLIFGVDILPTLIVSGLLACFSIWRLISKEIWLGPGRLQALFRLWLLLAIADFGVAVWLIARSSLWFVLVAMSGLLSLTVAIRVLIAQQEEVGRQ